MLTYERARPCGDRAFFLKNQTHIILKDCLQQFLEDVSSLLKPKDIQLFQDNINHLEKHPHLLFLFTLWNDQLVKAVETENEERFYELARWRISLEPLSVATTTTEQLIFSFNDAIIPPCLEKSCKHYLVSEFAEKASVNAVLPEHFKQTQHNLNQALNLIKAVDQDYYQESLNLTSGYLIVNSKRFIAGSSFPLLSLITLADTHDTFWLADYVVHESAHQYLYYLMQQDRICSGEGLYTSPLRKDPRPIEGIYHAVFVLARLVDFFTQAKNKGSIIYGNGFFDAEFIESQISNYTERFYDGLSNVKKHATLTKLGQDLLGSSEEMVKEALTP